MKILNFSLPLMILCLTSLVWAESSSPQAEGKLRRKYFAAAQSPAKDSEMSTSISAEDHYLALLIGGYLTSDAYKWGDTMHVENAGRLHIGINYKLGPMNDSMDWLFKADIDGYELPEGRPVQIAFMPAVVFPDATSRFPIYFGAGAGPGFFFKQITNESSLSIDYTLFAGARLFNVLGATGFALEGGLKNHFHLLSDGQMNGYYLAIGTVFVF